MLVDCPREFVVQLPCHEGYQDGTQPNDARNDDEERLRLRPDGFRDGAILRQHVDRRSNLLHLDGAIDQQSHVTQTETDNLNGILHPQSIVNQDQLVEETEAVQGQEGGDGSRGGT